MARRLDLTSTYIGSRGSPPAAGPASSAELPHKAFSGAQHLTQTVLASLFGSDVIDTRGPHPETVS